MTDERSQLYFPLADASETAKLAQMRSALPELKRLPDWPEITGDTQVCKSPKFFAL